MIIITHSMQVVQVHVKEEGNGHSSFSLDRLEPTVIFVMSEES